jgi:hypothetical protein
VLGPYRTPAEIEPAPFGLELPPPQARTRPEPDEFVPVEREHNGAAPLDRATADRIAMLRTVATLVLVALCLGSMLLLEMATRR